MEGVKSVVKWVYCGESGEPRFPEDTNVKPVVMLFPDDVPNGYFPKIQLARRMNGKWLWEREVDDEVEIDDSDPVLKITAWYELPNPFPEF